MTLAPVAAAPLLAGGTSGQASPVDYTPGSGLDGQLQADDGDATGIAGDVQLSDARTTFHGEAMNDSLGETVAGIGDVTGDGTDDVALAAPEAADGAGAVYHFFGPVAEGDLDASESDLTVTGAESGDWAGADVTAADLTGDGMRDLVIGAPQANAGTGAVYVFYGADLRAAVENGASEVSVADASVTMTGDSEGSLFGMAVAAHGHEHAGDDAPMLAVGAPGTDGDAGAVYTFSDVTSDATASDANAVVTGPAQGDQAGWSLAMADNYTDAGDAALIAGAPQHADTGAVGILTDVSGDASLADADRLLLGEGEGDRAGWAVDEAGDVDNDGLTDVVIGAPLNDAAAEDAGAAYVVRASSHQSGSTSLANADAVVRGEDAGDTAGYDVSAAGSGDVTCDEYDDILVGAPGHDANGQQDAGAAYIVSGGDTLQGDYSLSTAQAKLHGENAGDLAGFSVTDAMDVTDNGDEDVLVGAPGADKNAGAAYLVEGQCPGDGVAEEPRTDEPVVEEPKEPAEEEPAEEEPADEEPAEEEPAKEEPAEEEPKEKEPAEEEPAEQEPDTEEPAPEEPDEETAEPESLSLAVECADDGTVTATLTNPNDAAVTVTAEHNGSAYDEISVGAGETVTLDGLPDGDWTFSAMIDDRTVQINDEDVFSASIDCDQPQQPPADDLESLTLNLECAEDGTVTATFTNPNDEDVTVAAEHNGSAYATFDVSADDTLTLDGLPDGDWAFSAMTEQGDRVLINGEERLTATIDCDQPQQPPADDLESLTLELVCAEDGTVTATISNPNDENVTLTATHNGTGTEQYGIGAGETVTLDELPDGDWEFSAETEGGETVQINDEDTYSESIDCDEEPVDDFEPVGEFLNCEQFRVTSFDNATSVTLNFQDGTNATYEVTEQMLEEDDWVFPMEGDENEGKTIVSATIDRDGDSVTFEQTNDCEDDGGPAPEVDQFRCFDITITGVQPGDTVELDWIDPNDSSSGTEVLTIEDDGSVSGATMGSASYSDGTLEYEITGGQQADAHLTEATVARNGQTILGPIENQQDCGESSLPDLESITYSVDCEDDTGLVTVTNPNEEGITVAFENESGGTQTLTVGANTSNSISLPNGDYTIISVETDGGDTVSIDGDESFTVDCEGEPVDEFEPAAEYLSCTEFYVTGFDNATSVTLNFQDGSSQTFDVTQDMLDDGQWTFLGTGDNDGKTIVSATIERNGESETFEQTNNCDNGNGDDVTTAFTGCSQVTISGLEDGDDVRVVAIGNDGNTSEYTTTISGTSEISIEDTNSAFSDLNEPKIYEVYVNGQLVEQNFNVETNSEGNYTCAGAGSS